MSEGTSAEIAARATGRFEKARQITFGSYLFVTATFATMALVAINDARQDGELGPPRMAVALVVLLGLCWLCTRLVRAGLSGAVRRRDLVLSGVLAIGLAALLVEHPMWTFVGPLWASVAALCLSTRRQIAALCTGTAAVCGLFALVAAEEGPHWYTWPAAFAGSLIACAVVVVANLVQKGLWDLFREAYAAREAQAALAVTEERLRFARDLHDLLGHSLSLVAVKSELAIRLTDADPARARAEMADVRQAARDALREVRAAVRGYRTVELDAELASVRAVLEAAGVRCTLDDPPGGLPSEVGQVLAWVVREGATNVLKHSRARTCRISLAAFEGSVVLEMTNDGAEPPGPGGGTGLVGLTERAAVLDGTLTAEYDGGGRFVLRAAIPLPAPVGSVA